VQTVNPCPTVTVDVPLPVSRVRPSVARETERGGTWESPPAPVHTKLPPPMLACEHGWRPHASAENPIKPRAGQLQQCEPTSPAVRQQRPALRPPWEAQLAGTHLRWRWTHAAA